MANLKKAEVIADGASMGQETVEYVKGSLTDEEIGKTVSLLKVVWPDAGFTREYINWLYRENPSGRAEIFNAWDKGEIVAHYAAIPVKARLFGELEKGLLSLNIAVSPAHRARGYFKALGSRTFESACERGFGFAAGVANANSTLLFRRQLRFQLVCPLDVKIGAGPIARSPGRGGEERDYIQSWDGQTLSWRLRRPGAKYRCIKRVGSMSVFAHTGKYGIWAVMNDIDPAGVAPPEAGHLRWNPLNVWIGLNPEYDWAKSAYINLPERFKPSPLNLIFRDLTGRGRVLDPQKTVFSLLDFDAY
ncbi:MAG: GNAT family N-acetyltransferase [Nitrospinae bacterium]|nr:GNAT family N-acetyltransferase [Nitrospinota bacterium]